MSNFANKLETFSRQLFQLLGFHPILKGPASNVKFYKIKEKLVGLWSWIILLLTSFALAFALHFGDFIFANDNTAGKANDMLKFLTLYTAFCITILEKFFQKRKLFKTYKKLVEFENESKKLMVDYQTYWKDIKSSFSRKFILTLVVSLGMEMVMLFSVGIKKQWQYFWMVNLLPLLACRILHSQYIYYLTIVKFHSAIIRDELQKLVDLSKAGSNFSKEILERLQVTKNLYGILHELNMSVNEYFTFSITANFVHEYVQCGCDSYWTYIAFTTSKVALFYEKCVHVITFYFT